MVARIDTTSSGGGSGQGCNAVDDLCDSSDAPPFLPNFDYALDTDLLAFGGETGGNTVQLDLFNSPPLTGINVVPAGSGGSSGIPTPGQAYFSPPLPTALDGVLNTRTTVVPGAGRGMPAITPVGHHLDRFQYHQGNTGVCQSMVAVPPLDLSLEAAVLSNFSPHEPVHSLGPSFYDFGLGGWPSDNRPDAGLLPQLLMPAVIPPAPVPSSVSPERLSPRNNPLPRAVRPERPLPVPIAPGSTSEQLVDRQVAAQPPRQKRKRFDNQQREKVKKVRKSGACLRCRIYNTPCDEDLPCKSCSKTKNRERVYRGPCVRPKLDEIQTFRAGDGDNGATRSELRVYQWPKSGLSKAIKLRWPFQIDSAHTPALLIVCEEFVPRPRPLTENLDEEFVVGGLVRQVKMPPWACRDTRQARLEVDKFMKACQTLFEDEIRDSLDDSIQSLTWAEALRYRNASGSEPVASALQLYAGAMLNSKYPTPVEVNDFGAVEERETPHFFEKLPLPPQLTYQFQTMVILTMLDIQKAMVKKAKERIFSKDRKKHWYELYLCIFVLLMIIEWVYRVQIRFAKAKEGVSTKNLNNISFVSQTMLGEWEMSAFNLIDHFRCVMCGDLPFTQSWADGSDNAKQTVGLDASALEYIRRIQQEISTRRDELQSLRSEKGNTRYEKPLSMICELFLLAEERK